MPEGGQMTEARMSDDLAQSGGPNGGNPRGVAKDLLHLLAEIGATVIGYFWRPLPASDVTAENRGENGPGKARLVSTTVEKAAVKPSVTESFPATITADVLVGPEPPTNRIAHTVLDDREIQRRRDLVRRLFNDFWSEANDKPVAFVDRLAQAEPYINERLIACGEFWQLDAETRMTLGLPSTKNRANPRLS
jgi:hypothetical protein